MDKLVPQMTEVMVAQQETMSQRQSQSRTLLPCPLLPQGEGQAEEVIIKSPEPRGWGTVRAGTIVLPNSASWVKGIP